MNFYAFGGTIENLMIDSIRLRVGQMGDGSKTPRVFWLGFNGFYCFFSSFQKVKISQNMRKNLKFI
jgi:hypothetical protein